MQRQGLETALGGSSEFAARIHGPTRVRRAHLALRRDVCTGSDAGGRAAVLQRGQADADGQRLSSGCPRRRPRRCGAPSRAVRRRRRATAGLPQPLREPRKPRLRACRHRRCTGCQLLAQARAPRLQASGQHAQGAQCGGRGSGRFAGKGGGDGALARQIATKRGRVAWQARHKLLHDAGNVCASHTRGSQA